MKSQLRPIAVSSRATASKSVLLGGILTSVALLPTPVTVLAQNPQSDLDSFMDTLSERLVLSEEQVAQVRPIMEAQFQNQHELAQRSRDSGNRDELQDEMDRGRQETHERLTNVLTERQMSEYHVLRQEQQRATRGQGQGGQGQGVERGQGQGCQGQGCQNVERGQVISKIGSIKPLKKFMGEVYVLKKEEGGRHTPFFNGYRPQFYLRTTDVTGSIKLPENVEMVMPGDNIQMEVELHTEVAIELELRFAIREGGRTVGAGVVTEILE